MNFNDADLTGAFLHSAKLNEAYLVSAKLGEATLTCADLTGASLNRADLSGVDLNFAKLTGADLRGAGTSLAHGGPPGRKFRKGWLRPLDSDCLKRVRPGNASDPKNDP